MALAAPAAAAVARGAAARRRRRRGTGAGRLRLAAALVAAAAAALRGAWGYFLEPETALEGGACPDGEQARHVDVMDDHLYADPVGITHKRRAGGCSCLYVDAGELTPERFAALSRQRRPFVLRGGMVEWGAMRNWRRLEYLTKGPWGDHTFVPSSATVKVHPDGLGGWGTARRAVRGLRQKTGNYPSACYFATKMGWARKGKERVEEWIQQCVAREEKQRQYYWSGEHGIDSRQWDSVKLSDAVSELFGTEAGTRKLRKKWYGKSLHLDTTLFAAYPELYQDNVGLPAALRPPDFAPKDWFGAGEEERQLLLGGEGGRWLPQQNGLGATGWTAVVRGSKLFYLWPGDVEHQAAFNLPYPPFTKKGDFTYFFADFDAFQEHSPELGAIWAESQRRYGDAVWDWEARGAHSGQRSTPLPPVLPMECIVQEGEILVTMDAWHTALNLEPALAVAGRLIDRYALPMLQWRMLLSDPLGTNLEQLFAALVQDVGAAAEVLVTVQALSRNVLANGSARYQKLLRARVADHRGDLKEKVGGRGPQYVTAAATLLLDAFAGDDLVHNGEALVGKRLESLLLAESAVIIARKETGRREFLRTWDANLDGHLSREELHAWGAAVFHEPCKISGIHTRDHEADVIDHFFNLSDQDGDDFLEEPELGIFTAVIPYDLFLHSTPPGNDAKAGAS